MLERRIKQEIRDFLDGDRKEALMVTGARQGREDLYYQGMCQRDL